MSLFFISETRGAARANSYQREIADLRQIYLSDCLIAAYSKYAQV